MHPAISLASTAIKVGVQAAKVGLKLVRFGGQVVGYGYSGRDGAQKMSAMIPGPKMMKLGPILPSPIQMPSHSLAVAALAKARQRGGTPAPPPMKREREFISR